MTKNKLKSHQIIYQISLCGLLLAMLIITKAIFKWIDLINGYSPQIQLVVYIYGLIILKSFWFKIGFYLVAPFATLVFGISGNIFFDYLLPCYGFILFLAFDYLTSKYKQYKLKNILYVNSLLIIFNFIGYAIMAISYIYSGVIVYKANFYTSFIINFPIVIISFAINLLIMIFTIFPIINLVNKYDKRLYW